jgi:hypothetical protein
MEDILFLRCFKGLSRKSLVGDFEGDEEEGATAVAGLTEAFVTDIVFFNGLPSSGSEAGINGTAGTDTDLECPRYAGR